MDKLDSRLQRFIDLLITRYPILKTVENSIIDGIYFMDECYKKVKATNSW